MKTRNLFLLTLAACAAMFVFAFITDARLADGSELPVRWDLNGEPAEFAPSFWALNIPALILLGTGLLFAIIPAIEPLQNRLEGSAPLMRAGWLGIIALMLVIQVQIGAPAWGWDMPVNVILIACGVLLLVLGNAMPKSRPGFFVGIRTPWTITNEDNWIATHRLGGKLAMIAGAVTVIASFALGTVQSAAIVMVAATLTATLIPVVYSWWFWKNNRAEGTEA